MSLLIEISCKKHPNYKAKRPPRIDCRGCGEIWNLVIRSNFGSLLDEPSSNPKKLLNIRDCDAEQNRR